VAVGSAAQGPAGPVPLPQAVRQTREKLVALLADGDPKAAEWVEQIRTTRKRLPTVAVVGETNRGKSSLVNALLAQPGLSPVDADVATCTYLVFGYAETPAARACYPGRLEPVRFDLAELPNWASATRQLPEGQIPPRYVEIDAPVPLLERLHLIDTPGVGGLESIHGELAREAATAATALLFVVDASAPLQAGELEFLRGVADSVETVVFALAKIDSFRGWRQVAEDNRRLLAEHAPRFAGARFHPVSARMFEMAAGAPNQQAAQTLRERSGVAELQVALQEVVVGRGAMLTEANSLRALATALAEQHAKLAAQRRALSAGEEEAEALRTRRDQLGAERRSSTRSWQVRLRGEVQRARVESNHDVARQMRDVQSWFRQAIDAADRERLGGLPAQVDAALQMVSSRLSAALTQRLVKVTDSTLATLFHPEELDVIRSQFARGVASPISLRPPDRRPPTAEDKLLLFMGVTGGVGISRVAALPLTGLGAAAVVNPVVLPVTIAIGLGAGWWMARTRKHAADKQHMKQWLTEAIADARATLDQLVSEQIIEAEQQLALALDEALSRRIEAIEAELRDVDRTLKLEEGERAKRLQTVDRRIAEVEAGQKRVAELLTRIRELRDQPSTG
jgi:predicted GTPase